MIYLICFGTRPELLKLIPIMTYMDINKIQYKSLFTGQHENLIIDFLSYIKKPTFSFDNIMEHNQSLDKLVG